MASTTGPPPEVLDEIKALFSWNPPRLLSARNKRSPIISTATRPSSFYNKHLSSKLVLKRVVRLPSLVQDLAINVDKALDAALTTLPSLKGLITTEQRAYGMQNVNRLVTDEKGVAEFYYLTTVKYCLQVASTLALHPSASLPHWQSLLYWTQSGGSSNYTVMDGQLCFMRKEGVYQTNKTWAVVVESMDSEKRRIFQEMGKSMSALATWEIRSTSACPAEVMNAVPKLGKFFWTFCAPPNCRSNPAMVHVKEVVVGPDAQAPPWSFPDDSSHISGIQRRVTLQRPVTRRVTRSAASGSSTLPPLLPRPSASQRGFTTPDRRRKRKRKVEEEHEMTAQNLVQEAWAQAVRADGTLIILHSGNHELVCVRHRASQTLYISDAIEPSTCVEPGYGKLHVGIYIAAIQDAMDRKLLSPISDTKAPDSDRLERSAARKAPTDGELVVIEEMIHAASECDVVQLYLQYDVYDSPVPASFIRSAPSIMTHSRYPTPPFSPRAIGTCRSEERLTIFLTSEIGRSGTGVIHRGTLKPEICDGAMPLEVVVKLSFDTEERDALKREYEVYCHLRSKGVFKGIATVLGLFDDSEDCACALVMLYAGVPLATEPQCTLSVSDRQSALSTLESIHRAGIMHGDICPENILIGDSGITIIDFGDSKQCDKQKAKDHEITELRYLLGVARKGH